MLPNESQILEKSRRGFDGIFEVNGVLTAFVQGCEFPPMETNTLIAGSSGENEDVAIPGKRKRGEGINVETLVPDDGTEKQWEALFELAASGVPNAGRFFLIFHRTTKTGAISESVDYGRCYISKVDPGGWKKGEGSDELQMKKITIQHSKNKRIL